MADPESQMTGHEVMMMVEEAGMVIEELERQQRSLLRFKIG